MAQQNINLGTGELTNNGESLRSAFTKIEDNFNELYASRVVSSLTDISVITQAAAGGGALSYDSNTGVITYTPPDFANYATQQDLTNYATQQDLSNFRTQISNDYNHLSTNVVQKNLFKFIVDQSTDFADFQQRIFNGL